MLAPSQPRAVRGSWRHVRFVAPLVAIQLGCVLVFAVGASVPALIVFGATASLQLVGITLGYHRLLAHRSFKTSRAFRFVLALCGVLACQNGPLWWVGHHREHHVHTDRPADPHSPRAGLFWSHMGWLFSPDCLELRRERVTDLERLPEMRWLEDYYYVVVLAYGTLLFALGEAWARFDPAAGTSGWQLVVWGCLVATVLSHHAIWSANSIGHRFGTRRYATDDDSRNNFIVSLFTFGDGWHHNHHRWPTSARHGLAWWELDLNYLLLRLLERLGLVWELRLPPAGELAR